MSRYTEQLRLRERVLLVAGELPLSHGNWWGSLIKLRTCLDSGDEPAPALG